jgi:hypothetical protein
VDDEDGVMSVDGRSDASDGANCAGVADDIASDGEDLLRTSFSLLGLQQFCKILAFHSEDYEECRLVGYDTVWLLLDPTFRKSISPRLRFLVTANFPSPLILFILMMKAISSSEMAVLTRATRHHIPEDGFILTEALLTAKCQVPMVTCIRSPCSIV